MIWRKCAHEQTRTYVCVSTHLRTPSRKLASHACMCRQHARTYVQERMHISADTHARVGARTRTHIHAGNTHTRAQTRIAGAHTCSRRCAIAHARPDAHACTLRQQARTGALACTQASICAHTRTGSYPLARMHAQACADTCTLVWTCTQVCEGNTHLCAGAHTHTCWHTPLRRCAHARTHVCTHRQHTRGRIAHMHLSSSRRACTLNRINAHARTPAGAAARMHTCFVPFF